MTCRSQAALGCSSCPARGPECPSELLADLRREVPPAPCVPLLEEFERSGEAGDEAGQFRALGAMLGLRTL